jgi:7-cyano-7-deazaguanine synthase
MALAIVLLSGGIDSATALYWAMKQGYRVQTITFKYRDRPRREIEAAHKIARSAGVNCLDVELPLQTAANIRKVDPNALSGAKVPEGYIPTRNLVFYALATYYAEIFNANYIVGGHLKTDYIGFPDATTKFFAGIEQLINESRPAEGSEIRLLMPFIQKSKADVLKMANEFKVPLDLTWTCYYDRETQCGKCASCLERADAFEKAGLTDLQIARE